MKKNKIYIYVTVSLVFLFLILMSPIFSIKSINVKGNEIVPSNNILSESNLIVFNKNIWLYPVKKYEKILKENPYFSDVKIKRNLPNEIEINVDERNIDFYTLYANNNYLYMDYNGVVLDSKNNFTKNLPIVKGLEFDTWAKGENLTVKDPKALEDAITICKTIKRYGAFDVPVVINMADTSNINIIVNNVNIVFGDATDCDIKVRRAIAAIPEIDPHLKGYLYVNDVSENAYFKIIT